MPIDLDEDQILVSGVVVELIDDGPTLPAVQPERLKPQRFTRLASPAVAPPRRLTLRPAGVLADGGKGVWTGRGLSGTGTEMISANFM
jgi:hypothetical protein